MPRPDEGLIHAWLDGELEAEEAARVEKLVAQDAEWAAAAAEARGLIAASSRILGALDVVPGDVIPKGGSAAPAVRAPRRVMPTWMKIAAGFVLVAGVSYAVRNADETRMDSVAMVEARRDAQVVGESAPISEPPPLIVTAPSTSGARGDEAANAAPTVSPTAPAPPSERAKVANQATRAAVDPNEKAAEEARPVDAAARLRAEPGAAGLASGAGAVGGAPAARPPTVAPASPPPSMLAQAAVNTDSIASAKKSADPELARERQRAAERADQLERAVVTGTRAAEDSRRNVAPRAPAAASSLDRTGSLAASGFAEPRVLGGCWRVTTTARVDTTQNSPRILSQFGDSLVLAFTPTGVQAMVLFEADNVLRGTVRDSVGTRATLLAVRVVCPQP